MEPKNASPQLGPERSAGYIPSLPEVPLYAVPEQTREQLADRRAELAPSQEQSRPTLPPPMAPMPALPQVPVPQDDTSSATTAVSDAPLVAGDDDLIEKEWVDKAKKIIAETKDDPYRRELEVGKLQTDYLRKRYGHELGEAA